MPFLGTGKFNFESPFNIIKLNNINIINTTFSSYGEKVRGQDNIDLNTE